MKKITRAVTKTVYETITICDTCGQEKPLPITWTWGVLYLYESDGEAGHAEFCSVACFHKGLAELVGHLDQGGGYFDPVNRSQNCTIRVDAGDAGYAETQKLVRLLLRAARLEVEE